MRKELKPILYNYFKENNQLKFISIDLGYGFLDNIRKDFPEKFIIIGSSEQLAMGIAIGLAENGYIPIVYSITPFLLFRAAEWLRNYLNKENVPVKLLGAGRNFDYKHDGFTHYANDDKDIMRCFSNIKCFWPKNIDELYKIFPKFIYNGKPSYLNIKR